MKVGTANTAVGWLLSALLARPLLAAAPEIALGGGETVPGGRVEVALTLTTNGFVVGAAESRLDFDDAALKLAGCVRGAAAELAAKEIVGPSRLCADRATLCRTSADCVVAPPCEIRSPASVAIFGFNRDPIAGGVLMACTFEVSAAAAPGVYALHARFGASDTDGNDYDGGKLPAVRGRDGFVGVVTPAPTPSGTGTPTVTETPTPTVTETSTATPTETPTSPPSTTPTPRASETGTPTTVPATPTATRPACAGDCDGGGTVTVEEIVVGVNIALGVEPLGRCGSFDVDADSQVGVEELVAAVNHALRGCPLAPGGSYLPRARRRA